MSIYTEKDLKNLKADIAQHGVEKAAMLWIKALASSIVRCGVSPEEARHQAFEVIDDMVEEIMGGV